MRQIICDCCRSNITEQTIYRPLMGAMNNEEASYSSSITTEYDLCRECAQMVVNRMGEIIAGEIGIAPENVREKAVTLPELEEDKSYDKYPAPRKVHRFSEEDKTEIRRLYEEGISIKSIAGKFKTSYSAVYKFLGAVGILKNRTGDTAGV